MNTFQAMEQNINWQGFGYLGERNRMDSTTATAGDARALATAKGRKLSKAALFAWANSRTGRFYGELVADAVRTGNWTKADRYLPHAAI